MDVLEVAKGTIAQRKLAFSGTPVLLMVSGGSDSTALAYVAHNLAQQGAIGPLAMLHVNHKLRGADADDDAAFVAQLAELLGIPLFACDVDIPAIAAQEGGNIEAIARRERYAAAHDALVSLCRHAGAPVAEGRIFTAHTADDRVENFYMRSIVGTGPGGFRSMRYLNGNVARPLLETGRQDLRDYLQQRASEGVPVARDGKGALWREDATNEHTDRFRAYVRAQIVPRAKERNPQLLQTLSRTMDLIADEDDMLAAAAAQLQGKTVAWVAAAAGIEPDYEEGCLIAPELALQPKPLQRRLVAGVLQSILGADARVETSSVDAVLEGFASAAAGGAPAKGAPAADGAIATEATPPAGASLVNSGYVANIQGNLAVSANKQGVRIEPMAVFRARRKRL